MDIGYLSTNKYILAAPPPPPYYTDQTFCVSSVCIAKIILIFKSGATFPFN